MSSGTTPTTTAPQARNANAYLRTRVLTASPEELRLMLLDGALKFANQGRDGLARKDFEASFNGFSQCREIIIELLTSIRSEPNPELAERVKSLYTFMYKHLVEGVHEKDLKKIDAVIELLGYERETWVLLMQKAAREKADEAAPAQNERRDARPAFIAAG
jgi:flagellar protein FliS